MEGEHATTVNWTWRQTKVQAEDILSAARTLEVKSSRYEIDLVSDWTSSDTYLQWAHNSLAQNTPLGFDAALCYAKRSACREIDAFMICNHFGRFRGTNYPAKMKMLSQVGLSTPDLIYELIIDPRNDVEHSYKGCTWAQAKRAVELA